MSQHELPTLQQLIDINLRKEDELFLEKYSTQYTGYGVGQQ